MPAQRADRLSFVNIGPIAGLGIRPDKGMIVAGAFDKKLYLIDARSWRLMSVRPLYPNLMPQQCAGRA